MELGHKLFIENHTITTDDMMHDQGSIRSSRKISNCIDVPLPCSKRKHGNLSSSMSPSTSSFSSISTSKSCSQSLTPRSRTCSLSSRTLSDRLSSPISGLVPRGLRNSLSKLIRRGSISGEDLKSSLQEESNTFDSISQHSVITPITEEIVKDSIEKGLPIIPFSCPAFSIADKKYEESKIKIKDKSSHRLDTKSQGRGDHKVKYNSKILNSPSNHTDNAERKISNDSQSAYVEMDPSGDEFSKSYHQPIGWNDNPYMNIDELSKMDEDTIFEMEEKELFRKRVNSYSPFERKQENNEFQNQVQEVDTFCRKGNKHKDDYVYVDFQHTKDKGRKNKTSNRWSILKFSTTT